MTPELEQKLEACQTLPTPPGVAAQIVGMARDPEVDMVRISDVLASDPAITIKILRLANSPLLGQRRPIESIRQAVIVLGLEATVSLALSFSLLKSWQSGENKDGLDYGLFWRRAILAASVGRVLAKALGIREPEEVFLTCLIQDVGILALSQTVGGIYAGLGREHLCQDLLIAHERERVGADHAEVGGWLLKQWNLPDRIVQAVSASHDPEKIPADTPEGRFVRCVAVSDLMAETFVDKSGTRRFKNLAESAERLLGVDKECVGEILEVVSSLIPDLESLFDTQGLVPDSPDRIIEEAREVLMLRNLRTLQTVGKLQEQAELLEASNRRDGLTGLFNRRYVDEFLADAFQTANATGHPLSVAYADLDNFKVINDTYGHHVGDQVLRSTGKLLDSNVRLADVAARYGGEEFILAFPNTGSNEVKLICERIVRAFKRIGHRVGDGLDLTVTISIGVATHVEGSKFASVKDLVRAADKALYTAKLEGKKTLKVAEPVEVRI